MHSLKFNFARIAFACLLLTVGFASTASAQPPGSTSTFRFFVDVDPAASPATGCPIPTTLGTPLTGIDQIVTVVVNTGPPPTIASSSRQVCSGGVFVAATPPAPPGAAMGPLPGPGNLSTIETSAPLASLPTAAGVRVYFDSIYSGSNSPQNRDELLTLDGTSLGGGIIVQLIVGDIPTLSEWGLILLALLLSVSAFAVMRRRGEGRRAAAGFLLVVFALGAGVAWAAITITVDGNPGDWTVSGITVATDSNSPPALANADIEKGYGVIQVDSSTNAVTLFLRIDVKFTGGPLTNNAPVVNAATFSVAENSANGTNVGTVTVTDPDAGQTHTFAITAGNTGGAFAINPTTGQITVANVAALDFETTPTFSLTVQATDNGTPNLSGTGTVTVNLTNVNEAPVVNPATFAVSEDATVGTNVGTVTFTDPDAGQTHTFAITAGNTGGAFAINPTTGQISVAGSLDATANPSYSLTVQVTDNGTPALSGTATVTVNVTDVNHNPVVNPATFSLAENSPNTTSVGTVTFTDPDPGQTHTFSITAGNTGGAFAIDPSTGQITVANASAVDFETNPTFSLTVQVTDNGTPALSGTATITVNLTDVNEVPVVNPATFGVAEDAANGTNVGPPVTFTDPDAGQTHTFSITAGNTSGAFAIDPSTGQITVANTSAIDFETNPTFSLTVQVTDNGTPVLSGTATITINVANDNEAPTVNPATFTVAEGAANGTTVGTVTFTDPDTGQTHTFAITAGNTGGAFAIDPSTGVITVANGAAIDFETTPSYSLTVQVTDDGTPNLSGTATITINVTDGNDAPVVNPATFSVAEDAAISTTVGTVTFTDPDTGQTHTFSITAGNTGGAFAIDPSTGVITVASTLNFEVTPSYSLTVQVTDNGTPALSGTATVTINVTDVNETPVVNPATFAVAEGAPAGTNVGTVTFTDPDTGQTHTFSITAGNTGGVFAIDPSTGQITVAGTIDFETTPSYSLTVQVTDNGTPALSGTATVTVNVTNLNETPVVNPATFSVPENSANGTNVGTVTFTDPDSGQTHTFSITAGNTGGAFAINPSTGQITVAGTIDFETTPSYSLTVQVTDNGTPALSGTATVTVNVTDANETPVVNPATFTIAENSANGTAVGTVTFTDSDLGQTHTFSIMAGNTGGAFAINPSTGAITVANSAAVDFETTSSFSLTVQVTDNGTPNLSGTATVTINLTNANDAPVVNPATFTIPENSANGTAVGTVTFTDQDSGQTHLFSITGGNTGGAFAINPSTGAITVADSTALNFETTPSFSLTVQVMDNGTPNLFGTATVTVNLTNVNEPPVVNAATFTINENSANGTAIGTVTFADMDAGQTHTFAITAGNTGGAFAINPSTGAITVANSAVLNFEATPSFSLTVQVTDNGTPVLSGTATITINLNDVPEPPTANPDSYDTVGNTLLQVAATETATGPHVFATGSVLSNDTDQDVPSTLTVSLNTASPGAQVTLNPNGTFTYVPPPGAAGPTDTFTYNLTDNTFTVTGTVTIRLIERVWYVRNNAGAPGNGTSISPFNAITAANLSDNGGDGDLTDDADSANDYIFVYLGDGTATNQSGGLVLEGGQRLFGQEVGLTVKIPASAVTFNGVPAPLDKNLLTATPGRPMLDDTVVDAFEGVSARDLIPAEIAGLNLAGNVNGIDWTTTAAFAGTGELVIRDNIIRSATNEGVDINLAGTGATRLAFYNNNLTATGTALDIQETGTGALTITAFQGNVVSGNTGGSGIVVSNAIFDSVPGGGLDTVDAVTLVIGATGAGNGVGGAGLALGNVQGDLHFSSNLNIFADGGAGLTVSGTGAGFQFRVNASGGPTGIIEATGGAAVDASAAALNLRLTNLRSTNSTATGVSLTNVTGTFSSEAGSITNATGTDFAISGGTANVTYKGTITDDVGQLVSVSGATAGTKSFEGAITDGDDGDGSGISLSGNTGATVRFAGGLTLSTGGNPAFAATGGGTVEVCDEVLPCNGAAAGSLINKITTTTGTALNVANTMIGGNNLEFRSISAGTAAGSGGNGITLSSTGTAAGNGGLVVRGTVTAGSGGTIQHKTGADGSTTSGIGIYLNQTKAASFNRMQLNDFDNFAIRANEVVGLTLSDIVVSGLNGNSAAADEGSLFIEDSGGTIAVSNTNVSGGFEDNLRVHYDNGTAGPAAVFNVTGSTFRDLQAAGNNSLVNLRSTTAASSGWDVDFNFTGSCVFENDANTLPPGGTENFADGILVTFEGPFPHSLNVQNGTFHHLFQGMDIASNFSADVSYVLKDNTITFTEGVAAIALGSGSSSTNQSFLTGLIQGNTIGTSGVAQSGNRLGLGIALDMRGEETAQFTLHGNTIRRTEVNGIQVIGQTAADGNLDLQITNNNIAEIEDNGGGGAGVIYGIEVTTNTGTSHDICLDARNNDSFNINAQDIRVRQSNAAVTFAIEGLTGSGASDVNVENYLVSQNPGNTADVRTGGSIVNYTSVANCATPPTQ